MNAVLEDPELRAQVEPMALETYHMLGELNLVGKKTELLRGIVLPKMPKSPRHCIVTDRLYILLNSCVTDGFYVRKEYPLTLKDSEPEPDVAMVRGKKEDYSQAHPDTAVLVMEACVSSIARDLMKAEIYAEAGVKEYWLVNANAGTVELYTQPTAQGYATMRRFMRGEIIVSTVVPGLQSEVDAIFA